MQIALTLLATTGWIVLAVIWLLVGVILMLLLAPLRFRASGEMTALEPVAGEVELSGLWGAIAATRSIAEGWRWRAVGVVIGRRKRRTAQEVRREREPRGKRAPETAAAGTDEAGGAPPGKAKPRKVRDREFWHELRRRGLLQRWLQPALRAVGELLRVPRWERLNGAAWFGTGDPAYTGMLCGALHAMTMGIPAQSRVVLDLRPDFMDPRADMSGDVALSLRPVSVLWIALRLLCRGPTWQTLKAHRAASRRRRARATDAEPRPVKG